MRMQAWLKQSGISSTPDRYAPAGWNQPVDINGRISEDAKAEERTPRFCGGGLIPMPEANFRISTHLKDIIGRDLVTNEYVAVFELVKNSLDARASRVDIGLDLDRNRIWIVDDGKGMDADAIRNRWLFVAYSAKAEGTEDDPDTRDYRDRIRPHGQYAGSKGIGRFSCDTLGRSLVLFSRHAKQEAIQKLSVEWEEFEENSRDLFQKVPIALETTGAFPKDTFVLMPQDSGTVLQIEGLRTDWTAEKIYKLRRHLGKLIDPFGTTRSTLVRISVSSAALSQKELAKLQGPVGNELLDLLNVKTTRIAVQFDDNAIRTSLVDRGAEIYRISEENTYAGLAGATVKAHVFYLNRSAKATFTRRMGIPPVEFGSVFLFLNGFRIFPIGEETDDTLGLNRRKQQGTSRYLGTRDVMGRVDVSAPMRMFREASSRDAGLIEDAHVRDLYGAILTKVIVRLERYVVGVTWKDKTDHEREDASALSIGATKSRVTQLIGKLAATKKVDLEYFNTEVIELFDEDANSLGKAMKALSDIAQTQGDSGLLRRIEEARARMERLRRAEKEAEQMAEKALAERQLADERIARLEEQATYLASTQDLTAEKMLLLLHQILIYGAHVIAAVDRALDNVRKITRAAHDLGAQGRDEYLQDAAAVVRVRTKRILNDLEYIHLENDRLMAVARFASNARFELESDQLTGDVIAFLDENVNQILASPNAICSVSFVSKGLKHPTEFRPVDLVVVVDNLLDNARKRRAKLLRMAARRVSGGRAVEIVISDDGLGLDESRVDPNRIFEKGYTSTPRGTGLGLYHARKVMQDMNGSLQLDPLRDPGRATFILTLPPKSR